MNSYEKLQLTLIASEYRAKGFTVFESDVSLGENYHFDAVAIDPKNGQRTIIELINANKGADFSDEKRAEMFRRHAKDSPNDLVDFRYIDQKGSLVTHDWARVSDLDRKMHESAMKVRLPKIDDNHLKASVQLIWLWQVLACILRGRGGHHKGNTNVPLPVLEIYNQLLKDGVVQPLETVAKDVHADLFSLRDVFDSATQGFVVNAAYVHQLRKHILHLRQELRRFDRSGEGQGKT